MHRPLLGIGVALLSLCAQAQFDVPRVVLENPIAGFSVEVPEDWEMATGTLGNVEIAIDAPTGASLAAQPALWFYHCGNEPEEEAQGLARALQQLGRGTPEVGATGNGGEWQVKLTSTGTRGPIAERWLCRKQGTASYVIGAMARPQFAAQFQADMDRALETCKLIPSPVLSYLNEPTENAYRMTLPEGWTWKGSIFRSPAVPGSFVWECSSSDGATGAFTAPPGIFNIAQPYMPAGQMAGSIILQAIRRDVPDAQLEGVQRLPRADAYFAGGIRALGLGANPRFDKVRADYLGTRMGTRVRARVTIVTLMLDSSPLLGGRGNWQMVCSGGWAPADRFDELFPVARGVVASLRTSPVWRANQFATVNSVLGARRGVMEEAAKGWDAYIRDQDRVPDPDGGPPQEVPNRDGGIWKDPDGKMHRVPPNEEVERELRDRGWRRVD